MKLYRFENYSTGGYSLDIDGEMRPSGYTTEHLNLREFVVAKETPKGYWIPESWGNVSFYSSSEKWISHRTKYCWKTKEEALASFLARKTSQIKILNGQLKSAIIAKELAEKYEC